MMTERLPTAGKETALGQRRFCAACNTKCPEGPDVCLGTLDGVHEACCGHGGASEPYVMFREDWVTLSGDDALAYFKQVADAD